MRSPDDTPEPRRQQSPEARLIGRLQQAHDHAKFAMEVVEETQLALFEMAIRNKRRQLGIDTEGGE